VPRNEARLYRRANRDREADRHPVQTQVPLWPGLSALSALRYPAGLTRPVLAEPAAGSASRQAHLIGDVPELIGIEQGRFLRTRHDRQSDECIDGAGPAGPQPRNQRELSQSLAWASE